MHPYLRPTAPIAPQAILTDDPKAAMDLASALCASPRMSNLAHGLWGYGGTARDGLELTVQSLGIGGPSASAVISELAGLGVRRAIRVGSCIAIDPLLGPGDVVVPAKIQACDGVGRARCEEGATMTPDPALCEALLALTSGRALSVSSVDLADRRDECESASAIDLSSAAVLATARSSSIACACVLVVCESASGKRHSPEAQERKLIEVGLLAGDALSVCFQPSEA